jgi:hypothetical protein
MKILNLQAFSLCTRVQESDLVHVLGEQLVCGSDFSCIPRDVFENGRGYIYIYIYETYQYISQSNLECDYSENFN